MEEQLISLKTAILAKEKGFDEITNIIYRTNPFNDIIENYNLLKHSDGNNPILSAPTQALLQRWLREKHNIIIIPLPKEQYPDNVLTNEYNILAYVNNKQLDYIDGTYWGYEEALEEGLYQALKLIN